MTIRTDKRLASVALFFLAAAVYIWHEHTPGKPTTVVLYGNVDIREVDMAFRQSGRINRMTFEEGDTVAPGDVLAELDAQPFEESLAVAQAAVQGAQAELDKMRRGNRSQEISQSEQAVHKADAALRFAETELARQENVIIAGGTTEHSLDQARTNHRQAAAELANARAALALKREGSRWEDIAAAEAKLAGAEANLSQARTATADTRLLSPSTAIVLSRMREPGSMITPSIPVYSLSLKNPVYVRAYVSESQLGAAVPGANVSVRSDSSGKIYHGQIGFVSPRAEFTPKSVETTELRTALVYRLRIVIVDADEHLRQGMPVTVEIVNGEH